MHEFEAEVGAGITLGQKIIPVETVGCYIPGGKYPLISAAIMSVATAKVAGVPHVIGAAPPRDAQGIYPATLYALAEVGRRRDLHHRRRAGVRRPWPTAASACAPVDMITGPGNAYVAEAKRQLFGLVGIDLPAGPTEILVIADDSADPALVATDLLGQAEHGPDSPAWLITTSEKFGREVLTRDRAPAADAADRARSPGVAWQRLGEVAVVDDDDAAIALSDQYAPEHLEVQTRAQRLLPGQAARTTAACSSARRARSPTATRASAPTTRCRPGRAGALHRRALGRQVPQDRHLPAADAARRASASRRSSAACAHAEGMLAHEITADVRVQRYAQRRAET